MSVLTSTGAAREVSVACVGVLFVKVAATVCAVVSLTVQTRVFTLQAPPHPMKPCPAAGFAVSLTVAPALKCWVHVFAAPVLAQAPAALETAPRPLTLSVSVPGVPPPPLPLNVAETLRAAVMTTVHVVAFPEQAPPQPVKVWPLAGVAISVTLVPELKVALHVVAPLPQLMLVPVTLPAPATETVSGSPLVPPVKVAVTLSDWVNVTVQLVTVPEQAPPQPVKVAPVDGVARSTAVDPDGWLALVQVVAPPPQLIPPPVIVPLPVT